MAAISRTITVTEDRASAFSFPSVQPEIPKAEPSQPLSCQELLDRLTGIIRKYKTQKDQDAQARGVSPESVPPLDPLKLHPEQYVSFFNPSDVLWGDPLSSKLFSWGRKVLAIPFPEDKELSPEQITIASKKIQKLVSKILVDPLDKKPFEPLKPSDPFILLERRCWPWAGWRFVDYDLIFRSLFPQETDHVRSPFDKHVQELPRSHEFAEEMFHWSRLAVSFISQMQASSENPASSSSQSSLDFFSSLSLVPVTNSSSASSSSNMPLVPASSAHSDAARAFACHKFLTGPRLQQMNIDKMRFYYSKGQEAVKCWILQQTRALGNHNRILLEKCWEEAQRLIAEQAKLQEANEREREQNLDHRLAMKDQNQQQTVDVLHDRINTWKAQDAQTQAFLEQEKKANKANHEMMLYYQSQYAQAEQRCGHLEYQANQARRRASNGCVIL